MVVLQPRWCYLTGSVLVFFGASQMATHIAYACSSSERAYFSSESAVRNTGRMCRVLCSAAPKVPTGRVLLRLSIFLMFLRLLQNSRPPPGSLSTPGAHPQFLAMGPSKHSSFSLQEGPGGVSPDYVRPTQDCSHLTTSEAANYGPSSHWPNPFAFSPTVPHTTREMDDTDVYSGGRNLESLPQGLRELTFYFVMSCRV